MQWGSVSTLQQHSGGYRWALFVTSWCSFIHSLQLPCAKTGMPLTQGYDAGFVR